MTGQVACQMIRQEEIRNGIRLLGLSGKCVCMHTSMRSFGSPIENGADGLLDAFLQEGCTVMVPAFSDQYEAPPVIAWMPAHNGAGDYAYFYEKAYENIEPYTPDSSRLTIEEMGIFPQMVLNRSGRIRGGNHLNSFAAIGPRAAALIAGQTNEHVYAPFSALYQENGSVLLAGTSLNTATAIHYAEMLAGRKPFVRWSRDSGGNIIPVCAGGCSDGFENLAPYLKKHEQQLVIGASLWRCFPIRQLSDECAHVIRCLPSVTHCGNPECDRCNDAMAGGPDFIFP